MSSGHSTVDARTEIDAALLADSPGFLQQLVITSTGWVRLNLAPSQTTTGAEDMSEQFEEHGSITVTSGSNTFTIDTEFDDTSDAYTFIPDNTADVIAFYNALNGTGNGIHQAGTLVLNDGASTTPDIPAVTGDARTCGFTLHPHQRQGQPPSPTSQA